MCSSHPNSMGTNLNFKNGLSLRTSHFIKYIQESSQSYRSKLKNINQQIHYTGQYLANKPIFAQMLKSRNKKKFRQEHQTEIELYESAVKFLKDKNTDGKIPSMKVLKAEKKS